MSLPRKNSKEKNNFYEEKSAEIRALDSIFFKCVRIFSREA